MYLLFVLSELGREPALNPRMPLFLKVLLTQVWQKLLFSYIPCYSKAPTLPHGAPSQLSYLGAEDSKRSGNRMNHLAAFDPKVEDHTLLPNLAWGSGSSGNLIKFIAWAARL